MLVKSVEVDIGVKGDRESKAKLDAISARADELKKAFPEYKLKIDSAAAQERLAVFRKQVKDTADEVTKPMEPVVRTDKAKAKLLEIQVRAEELKRKFPEFTLRIDDRAAKLKLAALAVEAKAVDDAINRGFGRAGGSGGGGILSRLGGLLGGGGGSAGGAASGGGSLLTSPGGLIGAGVAAALASALVPGLVGLGIGGGVGALGIGGSLAAGAAMNARVKAAQAAVKSAQSAQLGQASLANTITGLQQRIALDSRKGATAAQKAAVPGLQRTLGIDQARLAQGGAAAGGLGAARTQLATAQALAAPFTGLMSALSKLGDAALTAFAKSVAPILKPVAQIFLDMRVQLDALRPVMAPMFAASLPFIRMFAGLMLQVGKILMPAFTDAMLQMVNSGALKSMSQGLVIIVKGLAGFITALGPGMKSSATLFKGMAVVIAAILRALGLTFAWIANVMEDYFHKARLNLHSLASSFDDFRHRTAVIFDGVRHDIAHYWDMIWQNTLGRVGRGISDTAKDFADFRHRTAVVFDGIRHDIAHLWDMTWNNTQGRIQRGVNDAFKDFNDFRHRTAVIFDGIRHDIAHLWDMTWNNTIGRMQRGVADIRNTLTGAKIWMRDVFGGWVGNFFTKTVPGWFGASVRGASIYWNNLRGAIRRPVAWVVDNVLDGLIRVFDSITSHIGLGKPIPEVHPFGLAAGGRITSGTTATADDVLVRVSRGETVVSAAHSAQLAPVFSELGIRGYAAGGKVGQNPPGSTVNPRFGPIPGVGGVIPALGHALGKAADIGKMALAFATGNSAAFTNAFAGLLGHGTGGAGGIMARILTQIPKAIAGDFVKWIMGKSAAMGNGGAIANYAMSFLGKIPYVWGGTSVPGGADCSGFSQAIYRHFGINAPRTSEEQGAWVRKSGPVPGGLAFYDSPAGGAPPGHVAIVRSAAQVISQGGGMGPTLMNIHAMPLMWTGVPPGGLRGGGGGGATGGTMSAGAIAALWTQMGGPGWAASNMARIAFAESGDRPGAIQQGQPPGLTGWGLYQITPTSGINQNGAFGNLLNAANNTRAAISLFAQSAYSPWTSDPVGSSLVGAGSRHGFDTGYGTLPPGLSLSWNGTGHPEPLMPASRRGGGGGVTYNITVHSSPLARPADIGREVVTAIKQFEKTSGKGWRS